MDKAEALLAMRVVLIVLPDILTVGEAFDKIKKIVDSVDED